LAVELAIAILVEVLEPPLALLRRECGAEIDSLQEVAIFLGCQLAVTVGITMLEQAMERGMGRLGNLAELDHAITIGVKLQEKILEWSEVAGFLGRLGHRQGRCNQQAADGNEQGSD